MSAKNSGSCVCGTIRFTATGEPLRVTICHCTWCQCRTDTAFTAEIACNAEQVALTGRPPTRCRHLSDESGRWL